MTQQQPDNIDRIQEKMNFVTITEFNKFVGFVNSELSKIYDCLEKLSKESIEFEEIQIERFNLVVDKHNQLIESVSCRLQPKPGGWTTFDEIASEPLTASILPEFELGATAEFKQENQVN
ncbi:hypothetical protein [Microcoleus sp. CAWBG640]|uniref:hypothetical protein n=1 Tax=Microcoleus sp. CAWBG640 TaxID=2841653 RepID=UPI00312B7F76